MGESEKSNFSMFHLRRIQFQTFVKDKGPINDSLEPSVEPAILGRSTMILLDKQTKIGRNPELVDVVLHSVVHSNMISRDHSEIVGVKDDKGKYVRYLITDRSLNGTYVNDTRVNIQQQLKEGDLIKFGHVNGAAIKAGQYAPQESAEFIFRFERALSNYNYFGYTKKRVRHQSEHRRAYMQINSDLVLPTEVYSLVAPPKALPPSSGTLSGPSRSSMNATIPAATVAPDSTTNNCNSSAVVPSTVLTTPSSISATIPVSSSISHNGTNGCLGANLPSTAMQNSSTLNHQQQNLAHLAFAAATTAATNSQQQQQHSSTVCINPIGGNTSSSQTTTNQQQQALLNQLGLGTMTAATTEEQVAALRSLMASDMERLAAQQQWQKSLFNLNSLQQQNPLIYGHAFPAAAVAAAALFSGIGGIDLNSAAANQTAIAASLWPNIRASLPAAQDWTQQQKAATLAHQLQLRLPVYQQPQQQSNQLIAANGQTRAASVSSATVASSLFGAPSAFSLPSQQQTAASVPPNSTNNLQLSNNVSNATTVGLLVTQPSQNQSLSNLSNAAYSSCTSSTNHPSLLGFRTGAVVPLSRGASSSSLTQPTTSTAHLNIEQIEAKVVTSNGWPNIGDGFINSSSNKLSPILAASARGVATSTPNDALQRIPDIASALAAAFSAAQQQQQANNHNNNDITSPINIPISVTNSTSKSVTTSSLQSNSSSLSITPSLQHSLAQRLLASTPISSSSLNNSTTTPLNGNNNINNKRYTNSGASSNFSSSSGISSAASTSLLQSPSAIIPVRHQYEPSTSISDPITSPPSSLNSSGASSAFSSAQQNQINNTNGNITNLSTLTAALFAADKVNNNAKRPTIDSQLQQQNLLSRSLTDGTCESTTSVDVEEKTQQIPSIDKESNLKVSVNNSSLILSLPQSEQQQRILKNTIDESKMTRLMECDSSVPSPPSKRDDEDEELNEDTLVARKERREEKKKSDDDENEHIDTEDGDVFRKRRSDSTSIKSSDGTTKPPAKHARKSNEVARLLNDLTAGNCSWQYMAERQQKSISKGVKGLDNNMNNKKPLRLDERKQMKIKKNNHKMHRQLSVSESSGEEEKLVQDKDSSDDIAEREENFVSEQYEAKQRRIDSDSMSSSLDISDLSFRTYNLMNDSEVKRLDEADDDNQKKIVMKAKSKYVKKNESSNDEEEENTDKEFQPPPLPKPRKLAAPTKKTPAALSSMAPKVVTNKDKNVKTTSTAAVSSKAVGKRNAKNSKETTTKIKEKLPKEKASRGRKPKKEPLDENSDNEVDSKNHDNDEIYFGLSDNEEDSDDEEQMAENKSVPKTATQKKTNEKKNEKKASVSKGLSKKASEPIKEKMTRKTASKTTKKGKKDSASDDSDDDVSITEDNEESTVMEDWTGGVGDPELCEDENCKRPKDMNIFWVQCEKCDKWFHSMCVLGKNVEAMEDHWYCIDCE